MPFKKHQPVEEGAKKRDQGEGVKDAHHPDPRMAEDKLDEIVDLLRKINRRDQMRMTSSILHTAVWSLFALSFVWSSWYFISNRDEFVKALSDSMINQITGAGSQERMDEPGFYEKFLEAIQ